MAAAAGRGGQNAEPPRRPTTAPFKGLSDTIGGTQNASSAMVEGAKTMGEGGPGGTNSRAAKGDHGRGRGRGRGGACASASRWVLPGCFPTFSAKVKEADQVRLCEVQRANLSSAWYL